MIYLLVTLFLDNILSYIIPSTFYNLNLFFPMLFISIIPILYIVLNKKQYFIFIIIIGIIYDVLYSDLIMLNIVYFLIISFVISIFFKYKNKNLTNVFLLSIFSFIFYDIFIFFILIIFGYNFEIYDLLYKVKHSILLNTLYIVISIFVLKSRIFSSKKDKNNNLKYKIHHNIS